jgi:hypothetical protein
MAQTPRELTPDRDPRHFFGAELRHWRDLRGLSQARLGREVHVSGDEIAKVEKALRWPPPGLAEQCDRTLDTGGVLSRLWPLVERQRLDIREAGTRPGDADAPAQEEKGTASLRASVELPGQQGGEQVAGAGHPGVCTCHTVGESEIENGGECPVHRRHFLRVTGVTLPLTHVAINVQAATSLGDQLTIGESIPADSEGIGSLRSTTVAHRRMDATVAARQLAAPAAEHLRRIAVASRQVAAEERPAAAEALSEAFGFLAWLAWDMDDLGSARRRYGQAVEAAREARNPTLAAYMRGSAAAFAASTGDTSRGLSLAERTGASLGADKPPVAEAWLAAILALAHASAGHEREALVALDRAEDAVGRAGSESAPWPWVFDFGPAKLAAYRLACSVRLNRPRDALSIAPLATARKPNRHAVQHALVLLDHAEAHVQSGEPDEGVHTALRALDIARTQDSERVLRQARQLRDSIGARASSNALADFDDELELLDRAVS